MAADTTSTAAPSAPGVSHQILEPSSSPAFSFAFDDFLRREYRFGLNPDRPVCKAFIQGHCPLGKACPDKHTASNSYNSLVCKHWLRGLCKKSEACEFLHEFNLRKMPECNFFSRHRYCSNGDDCLYLHIDPDSKLPPCPHYDRGFCPLGPRCSKRHVRKDICKYYLAGFCPDGKQCKVGAHPKWPTDLAPPTVRVKKDPAEIAREATRAQEAAERDEERDPQRGFGGRRDWGGRGRGRPYRGRRGAF